MISNNILIEKILKFKKKEINDHNINIINDEILVLTPYQLDIIKKQFNDKYIKIIQNAYDMWTSSKNSHINATTKDIFLFCDWLKSRIN